MKTVFAIALLCLASAWSYPTLDDESEKPRCTDVFRTEICDAYDSLDEEVHDSREKRQLDKDLLERLLKEKLNFLINFGLLKHIPIIGQFIHDLVERDPEGVSKALSGGIFAVLGLVMGNLG